MKGKLSWVTHSVWLSALNTCLCIKSLFVVLISEQLPGHYRCCPHERSFESWPQDGGRYKGYLCIICFGAIGVGLWVPASLSPVFFMEMTFGKPLIPTTPSSTRLLGLATGDISFWLLMLASFQLPSAVLARTAWQCFSQHWTNNCIYNCNPTSL